MIRCLVSPLAVCPACGDRAVRDPADYPAELLAQVIQLWTCDNCATPLQRVIYPGATVTARLWRLR